MLIVATDNKFSLKNDNAKLSVNELSGAQHGEPVRVRPQPAQTLQHYDTTGKKEATVGQGTRYEV